MIWNLCYDWGEEFSCGIWDSFLSFFFFWIREMSQERQIDCLFLKDVSPTALIAFELLYYNREMVRLGWLLVSFGMKISRKGKEKSQV